MKRLVSLIVPVGAIGSAGLAALATASCAVGSTLVALLGVSGAVAVASVIPSRPSLLGLSTALVAFALWQAYRPHAAGSTDQCTPQRRARVAAWLAAVATVVSAAIPWLL